jgi:hypothetical protein
MRTAREAARFFKDLTVNREGMCLWHVQDAFLTNHWYPSAIEQWRNAAKKHAGDRTPPIGAPVYWGGSRYGHIAIYVGNGMVRSTDAGGPGRMGTVPIDWFKSHWGLDYLGWTGDIGGKDIDFINYVDVYFSQLKPGVDNSDSVRFLRRTLIKRGFLEVSKPLSVNRPGNKYTPAVERAVAKWQKRKGYKQTGVFTKAQAREYFSLNKRVRLHF